jgi:hypothetical protein
MLKKILLVLSIIAFGIGLSDIGEASQWGLGVPVGAILLALSFIVMVLEKEMALYDDEERRKPTASKSAHSAASTKHPLPQPSRP